LWDTLTRPFYYLDQILDFHRIADRNKFGSFNSNHLGKSCKNESKKLSNTQNGLLSNNLPDQLKFFARLFNFEKNYLETGYIGLLKHFKRLSFQFQ
jgi:hypothetical protein